jgi:hypothetical protein
MIKYLVDSLQSYETGHGNALCPIATEADKTFMGEHVNQAPPSTEEIRQWKMSMDRTLGNVVSEIVGQVTAVFAETRLSASPSPEPVIRDVRNWRDVIQQWDVGDTGMVALKDWPKEWYQGSMKKYTGSLYSQRKKIAEEYERCVLRVLSGDQKFAK